MEPVYEQIHNNLGLPITVYHINSWELPTLIYCNWHKELEFIYVYQGRLSLTVADKKASLKEGDIAVVNMDEIHYGEAIAPFNCEIFVFLVSIEQSLPANNAGACRSLQQLLNEELRLTPLIAPQAPRYAELLSCLMGMYTLYKERKEGFELQALSLVYELFSILFSVKNFYLVADTPISTQTQEKINRLKKVLSYIDQNYGQKIYTKELADLLYMGEDNFYKFFLSLTGISPSKYILSYRMKKAAKLLAATDLPVTEVCYRVGFNTVSYFIKMFREQFGCTPKKYRSIQQNTET